MLSKEKHHHFLSLLIVTRNEEKYIDRLLHSLIHQDLPKDYYEIIIVDGHSDDKTIEIVNKYKDKYPNSIKIFSNKKKHWLPVGILELKNQKAIMY
ncbi:putative glycosyltransferase [Bacillus sp. TS-2]|nr:putative glycosyltransferase [Bacillus sp. TS-2]